MMEFSDERKKSDAKSKITPEDLVNLVKQYRERTFDEDIKGFRESFGGTEDMAFQLGSNAKEGITKKALKESENVFGSNSRNSPKGIGVFSILVRIFITTMFVSFLVSMELREGLIEVFWIKCSTLLAITTSVSLISFVSAYLETYKFKGVESSYLPTNLCNVKRDGKEYIVHFDDLKVGDLIKIEVGMTIPCDGFLVDGSEVLVDETSMTGDDSNVKKEAIETCEEIRHKTLEDDNSSNLWNFYRPRNELPSPILLSGTQIQEGEGWFMVVAVGMNSWLGQTLVSYNTNSKKTPLQRKLEVFSNNIRKLAALIAGAIVLWFLIRFLCKTGVDLINWKENLWHHVLSLISIFALGILVFVTTIPQGVANVVYISLVYSAKMMLQDMNLVKRLSVIEVMGSVNCIVADKTGTLTKNELGVVKFWQGYARELNWESNFYRLEDYFPNSRVSDLFMQGLACTSSATHTEGNASELAIMKMVAKFGCDYEDVRRKHLKDPFVRFEFTSRRKKTSTILEGIEDNEFGYSKRLFVKGASEIVFTSCSHYVDEDGNRKEINDQREIITKAIEKFAYDALRTLCLAYKDLKEGEGGPNHEDEYEDGVNKVVEKSGLTLVAILGIWDVIKTDVPSAIDACQKAGIRVRMVTGDNKITALAIAKQCNIVESDHADATMEGSEFYERIGGLKTSSTCMNDKDNEEVVNKEELLNICQHLDVLARARPEDKYALVTGLRELEGVVAVIGDGANDSPAIQKADVGIAMGISGTEVAKNAADIILLDDNFASVVKACIWGRNFYYNIQKALQFKLTISTVTLILVIIWVLVLNKSPLQPIQLLLMNLVMNFLASFAYGTEHPNCDIMRRPPYSLSEWIISKNMMKNIFLMTFYQLCIIFQIIFFGDALIGGTHIQEEKTTIEHTSGTDHNGSESLGMDMSLKASRHSTSLFSVVFLMQWFTLITSRRPDGGMNILEGLTKNVLFLGILASTLILTVLAVQFGQGLFLLSNDGLGLNQWGVWFLIAASVLPVGCAIGFITNEKEVKLLDRQDNRKLKKD